MFKETKATIADGGGITPPEKTVSGEPPSNSPVSRIKRVLNELGPGIVTGASDDDPSGIATYSQVGAQFGFAMLWTMLFSYPLMAGIQEISAWIGRVTGWESRRISDGTIPDGCCTRSSS